MEKDRMFTSELQQQQQQQQQQASFFNINWPEQSLMNIGSMPVPPQFELSSLSLVSSGNVVIQELMGRLGTMCNNTSTASICSSPSCYSAPLNSSMPSTFGDDSGFAERAMKFSSFGDSTSFGSLQPQLVLPELRQLSQVAVNLPGVAQFCNQPNVTRDIPNSVAAEETDPISGSGSDNSRKRKAATASKAKGKGIPLSSPKHPCSSSSKIDEDEPYAKRLKPAKGSKTETQRTDYSDKSGDQQQGKDSNVKPAEPPKDYIHVRARRGQATDSHSLAERVRREKISERMKFLQDLVPGCDKVTGKAVMLDEIINYVQSLQRQVEFLSMKLASVNPRLDFENILSKDMPQQQGHVELQVYQMEPPPPAAAAAGRTLPYAPQHQCSNSSPLQSIVTNSIDSHCSPNPLDSNVQPSSSIQLLSLDRLGDAAASQLANFWDDDLHSVVQMSLVQNQESAFSSQGFHGSLQTTQTKIEL